MTNELGTTLDDIQAKAERKREVLDAIDALWLFARYPEMLGRIDAIKAEVTIRKYIEEN